jgi:plasmid stability protein
VPALDNESVWTKISYRYRFDILGAFMPSLLIKDLTVASHRQLREQAKAHHRSMQKEAALLLNSLLGAEPIAVFPERFRMKDPPSGAELAKALGEGRR